MFWDKTKKIILRPFISSAHIDCRARSFLLQKALVDFGADESFAHAAQKIKEHYGVEIASSTTRVDVEKHAAVMHEQIEKNALRVKSTIPAPTIVGEMDGSLIPVVLPQHDNGIPCDRRKNKSHEWKEVRLAIARSQGSVDRICEATMGSIDDAGDKLAIVVKSVGEANKTKIHCVGDGACWIADQVERVFGAKAQFLLDFYHVSEYLSQAAHCCSPNARIEWMHAQQALLKNNEVDKVLNNLQQHAQACDLQENCSALKCFNYLVKRTNQLDYKTAIASDLPIGSGEVESAHKSLVQARLKIAGAWWDKNNAQNMLDLRTVRANGLWNQYWTSIKPNHGVYANG